MTLRVPPEQIIQESPSPLVKVAPGWGRVRLGDVASVVNGAAFPSSGFNNEGRGLPLVRIRDVGKDEVETYYDGEFEPRHVIRTGDLLIGMDGEFKAARWTGPTALLNQRVCKVEVTSPETYNQRFLEWVLPGYLQAIEQRTSAVTVKHLSSRTLCQLPLPLPPHPEQERIVSGLDSLSSRLESAIGSLASAQKRLRRLRSAVLEAAVRGQLIPQQAANEPAEILLNRILHDRRMAWEREEQDKAGAKGKELTGEAWRQRYEGPVEPSTVPFTAPAGWTWTTLDAVAKVTGGVTKDSNRRHHAGDVEVPYLRVANVQRGWLDLRKVETIRVSKQKAEALRLEPGDVLFNEGGDRDKLGRGWVWEGQIPDCVHQNHVFRARPHAGLEPRFLSWYGNTIAKRWFEQHGKQTTNLASLNLQALRTLPVPLPPLAEQRRIVDEVERRMSIIDTAEREVEAKIRKAEVLRASLLSAAFTGQLVAGERSETFSHPTLSMRATLGHANAGVAHAEHA